MIELVLGGYLYHVQPTPKPVKRGSFQKNLILKVKDVNFLVGNNSIGKPIAGIGKDFGITKNLNFKLGAYYQNRKDFSDIGVKVPAVVPVVGFEHTIELNETMGITNFVSPILTFSGFKIKF